MDDKTDKFYQLQKCILREAEQQLAELRHALGLAEGMERQEDVAGAFWRLSSLATLAMYDSGLDTEVSKRLTEIDKAAAEAMSHSRPAVATDDMSDAGIKGVLANPAASNWLKDCLASALKLNEQQACEDAIVLSELLSKRHNEAVFSSLDPKAKDSSRLLEQNQQWVTRSKDG